MASPESAQYGTSPSMANDAWYRTIKARAEFMDFAPMPCVCLKPCVAKAQRERMYVHVMDNRLEMNQNIAPFFCLTDIICGGCPGGPGLYTQDMISVMYFDSQPHRSSLCCFMNAIPLPFTCCGPPQVYTFKPKCLCISLEPCFGTPIKTAPCKCFGLKQYLICGNPCYENYGVVLVGGLANTDEFITKWQAQYEEWVKSPAGQAIPVDQRVEFAKISDNIGGLGAAKGINP